MGRCSLLFFCFCLTLALGCANDLRRVYGRPGASPGPSVPWSPPQHARDEQKAFAASDSGTGTGLSQIPRNMLDSLKSLSLADIVNIALVNNKQTRQAWSLTKAQAAAYGSAASSYFPEINGTASAGDQKNPALGPRYAGGAVSYSAAASLSWLIFDFGGRTASVEDAREALYSAGWTHNATIQNVILQVEQAYYNYFAVSGLLSAQQAAVNEAQTNLKATEDRHTAGLATIADILQARTALSQATLVLETLRGAIKTTLGGLAAAMGLEANQNLEVMLPLGPPSAETRKQTVRQCLDIALRNRPDLASARAQALGADARARSVRAQGLPSISASGGIGRLYFNNLTDGTSTYSAGAALNVPLFAGFSHRFGALAAAAQADAAHANEQNVKDLVALQVWTSFYNLETADQTVRTSADLLASATENHDVALGRYTSGVGSILDLLTAQASLEGARAQQVQAYANWWLAAAQLAHDMGALGPSPPDKQ